MSQMSLQLSVEGECPVRAIPYVDGSGPVMVHECGKYAVNIWPCADCDSHPGDPSNAAVRAFSPVKRILETHHGGRP